MAGKKSVYEIITENVIARIEAAIKDETGIAPWRKPWKGNGAPRNFITQRPYRGLNAWFLQGSQYLTWSQFCDLQKKNPDLKIRKGAHKEMVIYWNMLDKELETENGEKETKKIPLLRYYTVFSVEDIEGLDLKVETEFNHDPIDAAESVIQDYIQRTDLSYKVVEGSDRAYYRKSDDTVCIPALNQYENKVEFYSTAIHECAHASGHSKRLGRFKDEDSSSIFDKSSYSREELVAEMTSVLVCNSIGLYNNEVYKSAEENSLSYLRGWLKPLRDDITMIVRASAQAQKAADLILNVNYSSKEEEEVA